MQCGTPVIIDTQLRVAMHLDSLASLRHKVKVPYHQGPDWSQSNST